MQNVAILGASAKPDRYSHKALSLLSEKGYCVFPIHPLKQQIDGHAVFPSLAAIDTPIDTLTLYVNADHSSALAADIMALHPGRVIFNPGSENPALQESLNSAGIPWIEACTLVLLRSGQF